MVDTKYSQIFLFKRRCLGFKWPSHEQFVSFSEKIQMLSLNSSLHYLPQADDTERLRNTCQLLCQTNTIEKNFNISLFFSLRMPNYFRKVCLVTGGARGIGQAVANK